MKYTEFLETEVLSKWLGNVQFTFKKMEDHMCLIIVSMMGEPYDDEALEIHHWYKACTLVPLITAYEIYNNL